MKQSVIHADVQIKESWINRFVTAKDLKVPLNENYTLGQIAFTLEENRLMVSGEILEKPGSFVELTCTPVWNADAQQIELGDLQLQTQSKNLLLKTAGWFAQTFMQSKLDTLIGQSTNQLYAQYLANIQHEPVELHIPHGGHLTISVSSVRIHEMEFQPGEIVAKATIEGIWKLALD